MKAPRTLPLTPGTGGASIGWSRPIPELVSQLLADVEGLYQRLTNPVTDGEPAAYRGEKVFQPETSSFLLDTTQNGVSSNLVNYVVRDGAEYDIPIIFPGPGVFVARQMDVAIYLRLFRPGYQEPLKRFYYPAQLYSADHTTKFSLFPRQPPLQGANGTNGLGLNFFWNIHDSRSGRKYSDDVGISGYELLPRSRSGVPSELMHDGGLFTFDAPWVFERDGQVNFKFRPVMPVLQFDSSISGLNAAVGLTYDDRENGLRNQTVTVGVEILGSRFKTLQDAIRAGALTQRWGPKK